MTWAPTFQFWEPKGLPEIFLRQQPCKESRSDFTVRMRFSDWAENRQLRKFPLNQNLIVSGTHPFKVCSLGLFSPYLKTLRQSRFTSRLD